MRRTISFACAAFDFARLQRGADNNRHRCRQTSAPRFLGEQSRGEIALAGIGKKCHNRLTLVLGALGKLDRCPYGGAGGDTYKHAFLVADGAARGKGVVVFDRDDFVIDLVSTTSGTKPAPMP